MSYVLVVDDEGDAREAVARYLEKHGHRTKAVPNGKAAIESVMANTPDVIVLDWMMPEMDGVDFLRVLRSYLRLQKLPVIMVTAHRGAHIDVAKKLGVGSVFHKASFDLADLAARVDQLRRHGTGGEVTH
jgi:two-component system alkaline phosphatase synthesis response regulator PhoP